MILVVDASVAAKWLLPEPFSDVAAALLRPEHVLVAPDLIRLEVGSGLLRAARRNRIDQQLVTVTMQQLSAAVLRFLPTGEFIDQAFQLASQHGGSIFDAVYIVVARAVDAPVVSNDRELIRIARAAGIAALSLADDMPRLLAGK